MSHDSSIFPEILRHEGFELIGQWAYRLRIEQWWNPAIDRHMELLLLRLGDATILKGGKSYHLVSISEQGETWARDINELHSYLESHFPELRLAFSHFRDVPQELAEKQVRQRMSLQNPTRALPTLAEIASLQMQLEQRERDFHEGQNLNSLLKHPSPFLRQFMQDDQQCRQQEIQQLRTQIATQKEKHSLIQNLQRRYAQSGSAAAYTFSIHTNLHFADSLEALRDAVRAAVKEVGDLHRFQVTQKLQGGRLNIQVVEASEPALSWHELWMGGTLSPGQLDRLGQAGRELKQLMMSPVFVDADPSITAASNGNSGSGHFGARVVSSLLRRMDQTESVVRERQAQDRVVTPDQMPLMLGHQIDNNGKVLGEISIPLRKFVHTYISGTSGSGKSYLARVILEQAAQYENLSILVIDPRNQSAAIRLPEDRPEILSRYEVFGMKSGDARGFDFVYHAPGREWASSLPNQLTALTEGRTIISLKSGDDIERCKIAADVLNAVFTACSDRESEAPQLLILVDEAQLFTRKRVDAGAKEEAIAVERAIDRIAREGRKFGIVLILVSQTIRDFGHELASIRQQTSLKVFLRNTDRELDYAAEILGDSKALPQLPTGTCLINHADLDTVRLTVRPPQSKVFELSEAETREIVSSTSTRTPTTLSTAAKSVLHAVASYKSTHDGPLHVSRLMAVTGITSKRHIHSLLSELEKVGVIRTRVLNERGRPRVIELASSVTLNKPHES